MKQRGESSPVRERGTSVTRKGYVRYPHERLHQALWWMNRGLKQNVFNRGDKEKILY